MTYVASASIAANVVLDCAGKRFMEHEAVTLEGILVRIPEPVLRARLVEMEPRATPSQLAHVSHVVPVLLAAIAPE